MMLMLLSRALGIDLGIAHAILVTRRDRIAAVRLARR